MIYIDMFEDLSNLKPLSPKPYTLNFTCNAYVQRNILEAHLPLVLSAELLEARGFKHSS